MARKRSTKPETVSPYWKKRLASRDFRAQLIGLVAAEIEALAPLHLQDVVEPKVVLQLVESWQQATQRSEGITAVAIEVQRHGLARLQKQDKSPRDLLGATVAKHLEELLTQEAEASPEARAALERVVHHELVSRLLTDLVFTALVAFYQRVNPLFGAFTMRTLEDQIKTFIRGVLPMLQDRIVDFLTSRHNQQVAHELSRSIIREALSEPISTLAALIAPRQQQQAESLLHAATHSDKVDELVGNVAAALIEDVYAAVRRRKLGDLVRLEGLSRTLAEPLVDAMLPVLRRARVVAFVASESDRARPGKVAPAS